MKLSKKAIDDFKAHYLEKFGVALSDEEADDKAYRLLVFYRFKYANDRHD
jgi:hypothetical protein